MLSPALFPGDHRMMDVLRQRVTYGVAVRVIPDIVNRESIFRVWDGFRLAPCRNDGTVLGSGPSCFTPKARSYF